MTLVDSFGRICQTHRDKTAITFEDKTLTFGELEQASTRFARALNNAGIQKGDRVALFLGNSLEFVHAFYGVLKAGAIVVPLNIHFKETEAHYLLENSGAKLLLTDSERQSVVEKLQDLPELKTIITAGAEGEDSYDAFMESAQEDATLPEITDNDGSIMFYTSGTTGKPKGALLSHANMEADLDALKEAWRLTDTDKLYHSLPLYHIHGLGVALSGCLYNGYSCVLRKKFDPEDALKTIQDERCTLFMGVPTMYLRLLSVEDKERYDTSSMRLFISGSAPLSADTFRQFEKAFHHIILERAGMSETNMNFSNPYEGERRPGTVGFPLKGVQARIVDKDFKDLPAGEGGQLLLKGPNVFSGYWNAPEKTEEAFHDGWFITGDIARVDEEGYYTFLSRSKDLIISGGINIYPSEVEEVINALPEVKESAVIGTPDEEFGESVKAFVVLEPNKGLSADHIIAHCKEKLASFKKPKAVEFLHELPRNTMGKIQKNVLRERESDAQN